MDGGGNRSNAGQLTNPLTKDLNVANFNVVNAGNLYTKDTDMDLEGNELSGVTKLTFSPSGGNIFVDSGGILCYKNGDVLQPIAGHNKMFESESTTTLYDDDYVTIQWYVESHYNDDTPPVLIFDKAQPRMLRKAPNVTVQESWYDCGVTYSNKNERRHSHDDIKMIDETEFYYLVNEGAYDSDYDCEKDEYGSRYYISIIKEQGTNAPGYFFDIVIGKLGEWALFEMQKITIPQS